MILRCIATGSSGNSYALIDGKSILLLDLGVSAKEIKRAIDYRISDVVGAVVTHQHQDHSKAVTDFEKMGIPVFAPYKNLETMDFNGWQGTIQSFDLTDLNGKWMHTNADGSECPCYGFLITHPNMGRLLYITDTELVKWRFKGINHILISCNYIKDNLDDENLAKRNHVLRGHMELETVKEFVRANATDSLQNVILCHLSADNSDADRMVSEIQKIVPRANVCVAERGLEVELRNKNECPF